jgi:uncharacterized membrane protein
LKEDNLQIIFLISLFAGVGFLIAAVLVARMNWRADAESYRQTGFLRLAKHTDRYVEMPAVHKARFLGLVGAIFILVTLVTLICKLLADITARL